MDSHWYRNVHDENPCKKNMDSHSYRNVHDENLYTKKWIVIRAEMCMTKTRKNMDSHLYKDVHDETPYNNNMDSHSYKDVHDEYPKKYHTEISQNIFKYSYALLISLKCSSD